MLKVLLLIYAKLITLILVNESKENENLYSSVGLNQSNPKSDRINSKNPYYNSVKSESKSQTQLLNEQNQLINRYLNDGKSNEQKFEEIDTRTMKAPIFLKENFIKALNFDIKSLSKPNLIIIILFY